MCHVCSLPMVNSENSCSNILSLFANCHMIQQRGHISLTDKFKLQRTSSWPRSCLTHQHQRQCQSTFMLGLHSFIDDMNNFFTDSDNNQACIHSFILSIRDWIADADWLWIQKAQQKSMNEFRETQISCMGLTIKNNVQFILLISGVLYILYRIKHRHARTHTFFSESSCYTFTSPPLSTLVPSLPGGGV